MPLKDRVAERLAALNLKPATASVRMGEGIAKTFVRDILDERKRSVRGDNLERLAAVLETTPNWLLGQEDGGRMQKGIGLEIVRSVEVPVRGELAAGQWSEALARLNEPLAPGAVTDRVLIVAPNGYAPEELYALKVRGQAFNREYPDGSIVICTPASFDDVVAGDHVIVLSRRSGLAEATVREVVKANGNRWALEGLSTLDNPAEAWPVDDSKKAPEIVAIVVGSMKLRERPQRIGRT